MYSSWVAQCTVTQSSKELYVIKRGKFKDHKRLSTSISLRSYQWNHWRWYLVDYIRRHNSNSLKIQEQMQVISILNQITFSRPSALKRWQNSEWLDGLRTMAVLLIKFLKSSKNRMHLFPNILVEILHFVEFDMHEIYMCFLLCGYWGLFPFHFPFLFIANMYFSHTHTRKSWWLYVFYASLPWFNATLMWIVNDS